MDTKQEMVNLQEVLENGGNAIKTRDDCKLILIDQDGIVQNQEDCNWLPEERIVSSNTFRSRIEPWLISLFQSEHLSLLGGSGLTNAISTLAGAGRGTTMSGAIFSTYGNEIESAAKASARASGRGDGNIEDLPR